MPRSQQQLGTLSIALVSDVKEFIAGLSTAKQMLQDILALQARTRQQSTASTMSLGARAQRGMGIGGLLGLTPGAPGSSSRYKLAEDTLAEIPAQFRAAAKRVVVEIDKKGQETVRSIDNKFISQKLRQTVQGALERVRERLESVGTSAESMQSAMRLAGIDAPQLGANTKRAATATGKIARQTEATSVNTARLAGLAADVDETMRLISISLKQFLGAVQTSVASMTNFATGLTTGQGPAGVFQAIADRVRADAKMEKAATRRAQTPMPTRPIPLMRAEERIQEYQSELSDIDRTRKSIARQIAANRRAYRELQNRAERQYEQARKRPIEAEPLATDLYPELAGVRRVGPAGQPGSYRDARGRVLPAGIGEQYEEAVRAAQRITSSPSGLFAPSRLAIGAPRNVTELIQRVAQNYPQLAGITFDTNAWMDLAMPDKELARLGKFRERGRFATAERRAEYVQALRETMLMQTKSRQQIFAPDTEQIYNVLTKRAWETMAPRLNDPAFVRGLVAQLYPEFAEIGFDPTKAKQAGLGFTEKGKRLPVARREQYLRAVEETLLRTSEMFGPSMGFDPRTAIIPPALAKKLRTVADQYIRNYSALADTYAEAAKSAALSLPETAPDTRPRRTKGLGTKAAREELAAELEERRKAPTLQRGQLETELEKLENRRAEILKAIPEQQAIIAREKKASSDLEEEMAGADLNALRAERMARIQNRQKLELEKRRAQAALDEAETKFREEFGIKQRVRKGAEGEASRPTVTGPRLPVRAGKDWSDELKTAVAKVSQQIREEAFAVSQESIRKALVTTTGGRELPGLEEATKKLTARYGRFEERRTERDELRRVRDAAFSAAEESQRRLQAIESRLASMGDQLPLPGEPGARRYGRGKAAPVLGAVTPADEARMQAEAEIAQLQRRLSPLVGKQGELTRLTKELTKLPIQQIERVADYLKEEFKLGTAEQRAPSRQELRDVTDMVARYNRDIQKSWRAAIKEDAKRLAETRKTILTQQKASMAEAADLWTPEDERAYVTQRRAQIRQRRREAAGGAAVAPLTLADWAKQETVDAQVQEAQARLQQQRVKEAREAERVRRLALAREERRVADLEAASGKESAAREREYEQMRRSAAKQEKIAQRRIERAGKQMLLVNEALASPQLDEALQQLGLTRQSQINISQLRRVLARIQAIEARVRRLQELSLDPNFEKAMGVAGVGPLAKPRPPGVGPRPETTRRVEAAAAGDWAGAGMKPEDVNRIGRVAQQLKASEAGLLRLRTTGNFVARLFGNFGEGLERALQVMLRFQAAALVTGTIIAKVSEARQAWRDFNAQMASTQAITRATNKEMGMMAEKAREIGRTAIVPAQDAMKAFQLLGQAGLSASESIAAIDGVVRIAVGGVATLEDSVTLVTSVLRAFNLDAGNTNRVADVLVETVNRSKASIDGLNTSFNFAGPAAAAAGLKFEDMAAVLGTLANQGIKASTQATSLRTVLVNLISPTNRAQQVFDRLKIPLTEINPLTNDFVDVLKRLRQAGFGAQEAMDAFGIRGGAAAATLIRSAEAVDEMRRAISGPSSYGSALKALEIRQQSVTSQTQLAKQAFHDLGIEVGQQTSALVMLGAQLTQLVNLGLKDVVAIALAGASAFVGWKLAASNLIPVMEQFGFALTAINFTVAGITAAFGLGILAYVKWNQITQEAIDLAAHHREQLKKDNDFLIEHVGIVKGAAETIKHARTDLDRSLAFRDMDEQLAALLWRFPQLAEKIVAFGKAARAGSKEAAEGLQELLLQENINVALDAARRDINRFKAEQESLVTQATKTPNMFELMSGATYLSTVPAAFDTATLNVKIKAQEDLIEVLQKLKPAAEEAMPELQKLEDAIKALGKQDATGLDEVVAQIREANKLAEEYMRRVIELSNLKLSPNETNRVIDEMMRAFRRGELSVETFTQAVSAGSEETKDAWSGAAPVVRDTIGLMLSALNALARNFASTRQAAINAASGMSAAFAEMAEAIDSATRTVDAKIFVLNKQLAAAQQMVRAGVPYERFKAVMEAMSTGQEEALKQMEIEERARSLMSRYFPGAGREQKDEFITWMNQFKRQPSAGDIAKALTRAGMMSPEQYRRATEAQASGPDTEIVDQMGDIARNYANISRGTRQLGAKIEERNRKQNEINALAEQSENLEKEGGKLDKKSMEERARKLEVERKFVKAAELRLAWEEQQALTKHGPRQPSNTRFWDEFEEHRKSALALAQAKEDRAGGGGGGGRFDNMIDRLDRQTADIEAKRLERQGKFVEATKIRLAAERQQIMEEYKGKQQLLALMEFEEKAREALALAADKEADAAEKNLKAQISLREKQLDLEEKLNQMRSGFEREMIGRGRYAGGKALAIAAEEERSLRESIGLQEQRLVNYRAEIAQVEETLAKPLSEERRRQAQDTLQTLRSQVETSEEALRQDKTRLALGSQALEEILSFEGAFNQAITSGMEALFTGKGKFSDVVKGLGKGILAEFEQGFAKVLTKKLGFDKEFVLNMQGLGTQAGSDIEQGIVGGLYNSLGGIENWVGQAGGILGSVVEPFLGLLGGGISGLGSLFGSTSMSTAGAAVSRGFSGAVRGLFGGGAAPTVPTAGVPTGGFTPVAPATGGMGGMGPAVVGLPQIPQTLFGGIGRLLTGNTLPTLALMQQISGLGKNQAGQGAAIQNLLFSGSKLLQPALMKFLPYAFPKLAAALGIGPGIAAGSTIGSLAAPVAASALTPGVGLAAGMSQADLAALAANNISVSGTAGDAATGAAGFLGPLASVLSVVGSLVSIATAYKGVLDNAKMVDKITQGDKAARNLKISGLASVSAGAAGGAAIGAAAGAATGPGAIVTALVGAAIGAAVAQSVNSALAGAVGKGTQEALKKGKNQDQLYKDIAQALFEDPLLNILSLGTNTGIVKLGEVTGMLKWFVPNIERIYDKNLRAVVKETTGKVLDIDVETRSKLGADMSKRAKTRVTEALNPEYGATFGTEARQFAMFLGTMTGAGWADAERMQRYFTILVNNFAQGSKSVYDMRMNLREMFREVNGGNPVAALRQIRLAFGGRPRRWHREGEYTEREQRMVESLFMPAFQSHPLYRDTNLDKLAKIALEGTAFFGSGGGRDVDPEAYQKRMKRARKQSREIISGAAESMFGETSDWETAYSAFLNKIKEGMTGAVQQGLIKAFVTEGPLGTFLGGFFESIERLQKKMKKGKLTAGEYQERLSDTITTTMAELSILLSSEGFRSSFKLLWESNKQLQKAIDELIEAEKDALTKQKEHADIFLQIWNLLSAQAVKIMDLMAGGFQAASGLTAKIAKTGAKTEAEQPAEVADLLKEGLAKRKAGFLENLPLLTDEDKIKTLQAIESDADAMLSARLQQVASHFDPLIAAAQRARDAFEQASSVLLGIRTSKDSGRTVAQQLKLVADKIEEQKEIMLSGDPDQQYEAAQKLVGLYQEQLAIGREQLDTAGPQFRGLQRATERGLQEVTDFLGDNGRDLYVLTKQMEEANKAAYDEARAYYQFVKDNLPKAFWEASEEEGRTLHDYLNAIWNQLGGGGAGNDLLPDQLKTKYAEIMALLRGADTATLEEILKKLEAIRLINEAETDDGDGNDGNDDVVKGGGGVPPASPFPGARYEGDARKESRVMQNFGLPRDLDNPQTAAFTISAPIILAALEELVGKVVALSGDEKPERTQSVTATGQAFVEGIKSWFATTGVQAMGVKGLADLLGRIQIWFNNIQFSFPRWEAFKNKRDNFINQWFKKIGGEGLAEGGIQTKPGWTLLAEGGAPEAVVPLTPAGLSKFLDGFMIALLRSNSSMQRIANQVQGGTLAGQAQVERHTTTVHEGQNITLNVEPGAFQICLNNADAKLVQELPEKILSKVEKDLRFGTLGKVVVERVRRTP